MCLFEIFFTVPRGFDGIIFIGISLALLTTRTCHTYGDIQSNIQLVRGNHGAAKSQMFLNENENSVIGSNDFLESKKKLKNFNHSYLRSKSLIRRSRNYSTNSIEGTINKRSKRSVVHLYNMVVCATGCNPMSYKGYGCYCGFLGSGTAVDGIDQCCRMHDRCYDATECPTFLEYFVPYYWKCYRGYRPVCAVEHGKWGGSGSCAQRLCECDRVLSECLRRFPCPTSKAVCTTSPWRLIQNVFMIF